VLPLRLHPRLIELAWASGATTPEHGREASAAYRARQARWPAVAVGALDADGLVPRRRSADDEPAALDREAMEETRDLCLALVTALDADLAKRED
jgi:hypothetical protein